MGSRRTTAAIAFGFVFNSVGSAIAQCTYVLADRNNDSLYWVRDDNNNGTIDEPAEVHLFFDASNPSGTLGPMNPTALAACYTCNQPARVIMGDQINRNVYDLTFGDGIVIADATNATGTSFAFPTGVAFDSQGRTYVVNAGNASGNDGMYNLTDLTNDGDAQDTGEISDYVTTGAFGAGNGQYSPQELWFDPADVGYLRNSSANLQGIFRFVDSNASGRADDSGEFALFFGAGNASGITVSAGFALEPDRARPGALYTLQIATGGVDQLIRVQDNNADNDAQDAGEAAIVWQTAESGFSAIDVYSSRSGKVFVTDNSGKRVIVLNDLDSDGAFNSPGERVDFYSGVTLLGDIRQIVAIPPVGDLNFDFAVNLTDLSILLSNFGISGGVTYGDGDVDLDEAVDLTDLSRLLAVFGTACE